MSGLPHPAVVPSSLRNLMRPVSAAGQRTLPVLDALGTLFPTGLPRGVTVTVDGGAARSFAFALTAAAGRAGSWLAVLGLGGPGWRAAAELGVATAQVVHIEVSDAASRAAASRDAASRDAASRDAASRDADCVAAALDGFDLVLVGPQIPLAAATERRLTARARERGAVLIAVHETSAGASRRATTGPFGAVADLRVTTRSGPWQGLGAGTGHLTGRPVEIVVEGKRLPGRRRRDRLWLPGPDGTVAPTLEPTAERPTEQPVEQPRGRPVEQPVKRSA